MPTVLPLLLALLLIACADEEPVVRASDRQVIRVRPAELRTGSMRGGDSSEEPRMDAMPAGALAPRGSGMAAPGGDSAALASTDPAEREHAVLEFEGDLAALAPLATGDLSPEVRRAAVQRLADGERPIERAALRRALEDAEPEVVVEAVLALAALDEKTAIPALERLLAHPDAEVRALAEDALRSLRP